MDGRISNFAQVASLRRYTLTEGKAKGMDVIDCDNGKIRFLLSVNNALDIMQLYHEGQNVSFLSKNAFTAGDKPFLNRFEGGMLYTCGLDNLGVREGYTMHGTLHLIPAEIVRAECTEEEITVEAIVRDGALFGKNLVLRRKYTAKIGSGTLELEDTLENASYAEGEYCALYHVNLGYPMLDEGAKLLFSVDRVFPHDECAQKRVHRLSEITEPKPCDEETCYYLNLNEPKVSLVNEKIGKKFTLTYSAETLPKFVLWKSFASGDYAIGLEPATTKINDGVVMTKISAGEKKTHRVSIAVEKL